MQVAADLESWAITRNLAIASAELIDFRQQTVMQLFYNHLKINLSICAEIKSAWESSIYGEFQKSDVAWATVLFPDAWGTLQSGCAAKFSTIFIRRFWPLGFHMGFQSPSAKFLLSPSLFLQFYGSWHCLE